MIIRALFTALAQRGHFSTTGHSCGTCVCCVIRMVGSTTKLTNTPHPTPLPFSLSCVSFMPPNSPASHPPIPLPAIHHHHHLLLPIPPSPPPPSCVFYSSPVCVCTTQWVTLQLMETWLVLLSGWKNLKTVT